MNECWTLREKVLVVRQWNEASGQLLQTHQIGLLMFTRNDWSTRNDRSNHLRVGGNEWITRDQHESLKETICPTILQKQRDSSWITPAYTSCWSNFWGCSASSAVFREMIANFVTAVWPESPKEVHALAMEKAPLAASCHVQTGSQSTRSYKCLSVLVSFAAADPRICILYTWRRIRILTIF